MLCINKRLYRTGRPPRPDIVPDFEIHRLEELPDILEQC